MDWNAIYATIEDQHIQWMKLLDERQLQEVLFAREYARNFHHGTSGHLGYMTLAALASILDTLAQGVTFELNEGGPKADD